MAGSNWLQELVNDDLASGGVVTLPAGVYQLPAGLVFNANQHLHIRGHGTVLKLAEGMTGITVSQGIAQAAGVIIEGLTIDGQGNAYTTGVAFVDTNNGTILGGEIKNCATGVLLDSRASGKFVEGTLLDNLLLRGNTVGIDFTTEAGTGSFMQTVIRGLKCVVGGSGIGLRLNNGGVLMRSYIQGQFWIDTNQTGVALDGDINQTHFALTFEGAGGATGNTGLSVSTNATNTSAAFFDLNWTGTVATQLNTAKDMHYMKNSALVIQSTGTSLWGYRRHGDTANRFQIEGLTAGGKISFGSGGGAVDVNLLRSAVGVMTSSAHFQPTALKVPIKAGIPVDGDVVNGVTDGDIIIDTTNSKIMVRVGGTWKGVVIA